MGIVDKAKRLAGAGSAAATAWSILVSVSGKPVRERDKPAKVRIAGIPVFTRDESGERTLFWFSLGKRKS